MTRNILLDRAATCGNLDSRTHKLAMKLSSADRIDTARATLMTETKKLNKWYRVFLTASVLAVAVLMASLAAVAFGPTEQVRMYAWLARHVAECSLWSSVLFAAALVQIDTARTTTADVAADLEPVVNSAACLKAEKLLDANVPDVIAWRNLVVAERELLAHFDLKIMEALVQVYIAQGEADRFQAACKKVYDIPTNTSGMVTAAQPINA